MVWLPRTFKDWKGRTDAIVGGRKESWVSSSSRFVKIGLNIETETVRFTPFPGKTVHLSDCGLGNAATVHGAEPIITVGGSPTDAQGVENSSVMDRPVTRNSSPSGSDAEMRDVPGVSRSHGRTDATSATQTWAVPRWRNRPVGHIDGEDEIGCTEIDSTLPHA